MLDSRPQTIVGQSPALLHCLERADAVAPTDATVLVLGESGVGKELVARRIHEKSRRASAPLVVINCAAIPRELFESEFFGHVKGAFSGATRDRKGRLETAHRGTLFLDEVGEIPRELQGKLLRALQQMSFERVGDDQTRQVDVRVIAATNRSLADDVSSGRFRRDLYYRLSTFPIEVPPLRDRPEDIGPLSEHFLTEIAAKLRRRPPNLSWQQRKRLRAHDWPGNIRELRNVLERSLILGNAPDFDGILPSAAKPRTMSIPREPAQVDDSGYITAAEFLAFERNNLIAALEASNWRVAGTGGAADRLEMNASTLASRLKALDIQRPAAGSLYIRLGGRSKIAAMARDLLGRMQADPQVGRFWADRSTIGMRQEEKLLIQYLCSELGGPTHYTGRNMVAAHAHLDITPSDWVAFLHHLEQTFEALGLEAILRTSLREAVNALKPSIITVS
ncbi:MAG TPA: sigma 54-interacting transcriptional regulator [Hyphomicrobium sp.]|nr:sigma 54-interacting transcriptional regulator [Hyphomicrobium sp.]